MKGRTLVPILFVPLIIVVSGCIGGIDAETLAKASPIIQDFLDNHPNADILVTHFTANQSSEILDDIREECANPMLEAKDYYRIRFTDEDTGFYAVVWVDWENRQIECAFKKGDDTHIVENCTSHATYRCYGQHVYWFDSCGYKEDKKQYCEHGCDNGRCRNIDTCEQAGGYCIYPTYIAEAVTGMVYETGTSSTTIAPTTNECEEYYECPDGRKFRICEQVKKFDEKGNYIGTGCACKEKPEYLCETNVEPSGVITPVPMPMPIEYPGCEAGYVRTDYWCPDEGVCCIKKGTQCMEHARYKCDDGHLYWFDSCGNRQDKKEYCHYGCEGERCIPAAEFCGISTAGPCQTDEDCTTGGCSGQLCRSIQEPPLTTTCEWRDCYDAYMYGMVCKCVFPTRTVNPQGKCMWTQKEECKPYAEVRCYEGHVYWFDSCGNRHEKKYYCEHGCENGVCVQKAEELCKDSDGGDDIYVKGTATKGTTSATDHCNDDGSLTEKFCVQGNINAEIVWCPEHYKCENGRCVKIISNITQCAAQGSEFSWVYTTEYPAHCCEGLTEWQSGMDTKISIGNECYESGLVAGSPVGLCIECGNQVCEDNEDVCNCPEDCYNVTSHSDYMGASHFCLDASAGIKEICSENVQNLTICGLCEW